MGDAKDGQNNEGADAEVRPEEGREDEEEGEDARALDDADCGVEAGDLATEGSSGSDLDAGDDGGVLDAESCGGDSNSNPDAESCCDWPDRGRFRFAWAGGNQWLTVSF